MSAQMNLSAFASRSQDGSPAMQMNLRAGMRSFSFEHRVATGDISATGDAALAATLVPAMRWGGRLEVHAPVSQDRAQRVRDADDPEPRGHPRREIHDDVDIAVRPGIAARVRAEHSQPSDVMATADVRDRSAIDVRQQRGFTRHRFRERRRGRLPHECGHYPLTGVAGRGAVQDHEQLAVETPAAGCSPGAEPFEGGIGDAADGEGAFGHDCNMTA